MLSDPTPALSPMWEFDAADPEVGFLSDTVTHTCQQNLDADTFDVQPAETTSTSLVNQSDGKTVNEVVLLTCPACKATTTLVDVWPRWMFEEDRP